MSDPKPKSSIKACDNCGDSHHYMDTFTASAFDMDRVCVGCVAQYLQEGEWP